MKLFKVIETSFENFDNTIRAYLSKTLGTVGQQYSKSNIFGLIFEGVKGVLQNMLFYIEDALNEQNVFTAIRKKSIYSLAKISGYDPYYGSAANGTLLASNFISAGLTHEGTKIYLKNRAVLTNKSTGIKYVLDMPIDYYVFDLAKPLVRHEIKIVQGSWQSNNYTAIGAPLESVEINIRSLFDKEYCEVFVDGKKWSPAACLYDMIENEEKYVVNIGYEGSFCILFGNGTHGKQLVRGQNVKIDYLSHEGSLGNILPTQGADFEVTSGCVDGYGNKIEASKYIKLEISNHITGGTDADTIQDVRNMIGYNSRSLVIATEDNFKLFLNRFSFIGQTNIWMEKNTLAVTISCLTNKKNELTSPEQYFNLKPSDLVLSDTQKEMITTTLSNSNKLFAGISLKFQDPIISQYSIIAYVKIGPSYNKESIATAIRNSIATYFMNLDYNTTFIPKSDIVKKVIDDVPELISFDIEILSKDNEEGFANGTYNIYELKFVNGTYQYQPTKRIWDSTIPVGLDVYGNIKVESKLQVPLLSGGFRYYYDKSSRIASKKNNDYLRTETVQIVWI